MWHCTVSYFRGFRKKRLSSSPYYIQTIIQECLKPWRQKMMRDTKALNDYQSKQTVVFLIGYSTTLDQGFIASLPPFLTSIKFLMLLIHMDETYQKHHHPFEVQINCTIHSQTIHLPHNLRSPLVFCSGESLLMFHEFRFLSKLDFFHSCYVDVLDYENIPTINNQTIPKNWGSKKKRQPHAAFVFLGLWGRLF